MVRKSTWKSKAQHQDAHSSSWHTSQPVSIIGLYADICEKTYFSKNTHFHDENWVIAPPRSGPTKKASANTAEIILVAKANLAGGTSSKKIATVTA